MLIIKSRRKRPLGLNEPLRHESHKRPVTRRDFLAQGFLTGAATVVLSSGVGSLLAPRRARAGLAQDISDMKAPADCNILGGAGKMPFICFDLAGGANIGGCNLLAGQSAGPMNSSTTHEYVKQGLTPHHLPTIPAFVNTEFGFPFHSDRAILRGMLSVTSE